MKKIIAVILSALMLFGACAWAEEEEALQVAREILEALAEGRYEEAYERSTPPMQEAVKEPQGYEAIWSQLCAYGEYQQILDLNLQENSVYTTVLADCRFGETVLTLQITLDQEFLFNGFFINAALTRPMQRQEEKAEAETLLIRPGEEDETAAQLLLPEGEGPFPAVILIHGSGPLDMNASVYGFNLFEKMAEALCEKGIASIRYDKYTFAHASLLNEEAMKTFTVSREYFDDVAACAKILAADPRISHIYLLGHSQGGMLVPRMLLEIKNEKISGGVLLASSPLPLWEIQYAQNLTAIENTFGQERFEALAMLEEEREKAASLPFLTESELEDLTVFGLPAVYQRDEMSVDAAGAVREAGLPLLIVQGGNDWQVTPENGIEQWKRRLTGVDGITYLEYRQMNHLLAEQNGKPAGDETDYQNLRGISKEMIADLAEWIEENSR